MSAASAASVVSPPVPSAVVDVPAIPRADRWLPLLACALTLLAAVHAIEPLPVGVFYDDAQYVILAKSLATGHGYRFLNLPGAPSATHFPPGYPAFLALLWRISPAFPENVALLKFANALLIALVALFTYRFATRTLEMSPVLAFVATIAGTATIPSLVLSSAIMSEPLFLALLIPVLAWSERATRRAEVDAHRAERRGALFLGIAIGAIALVRTHGIALSAAAVTAYLARGRRRDAIACALATLVVVAPWMAWVRLHNDALPSLVRGAYGSYLEWLAMGFRADGWHLLAVTLPDNVATLWMAIVRSIVPDVHWSLDLLVGGLYFWLAALGAVSGWRRARVTTLFIAGYLAIVLVWPFSPLRFVWGLWPLLTLLPAAGLVVAWQRAAALRSPAWRSALVAAALVLGAGLASFNLRGYLNAWWSSNARFHARRVLPQLAWVARSTHPDDVVAADAEAAVYLYTGRRAVPVTSFTAVEYVRERTVTEDMAILEGLLDRYHPRYVLVTSPRLTDAASSIAHSRPTTLVRVDTLSQGAVYAGLCTRLAGKEASPSCE
ncbi:MAG TPA: hypothetical protein VH539_19770 [Gemmatimonadaceae bacterium]